MASTLTGHPPAAALREDPPAEETVLVPALADANPTTFSLFIERPRVKLDNSWPGKNADGTTLVAGSHVVPDGTAAFPSIAKFVRYVGPSERTARTCLRP